MRLLLVFVVLAACTAGGPAYKDVLFKEKETALIVYRPMGYLGAGAGQYILTVDDRECRLNPGSFYYAPIHEGKTLIEYDDSKKTIMAKANTVHYVKIATNDDTNNAVIAGAALGGLIGASIAESASDGYFHIKETPAEIAKEELAELKQDCL